MGKIEKQKENDGNGSGDGAKWGSATLARRVTIVLVLLAFLGVFSGCLTSLGTPLMRKIEPKRWIIEGGVGPGLVYPENPGLVGYVYVGRGLSEHFEIGILPYGYAFVDTGYMVALSVPVKWDPFAYEKPFHMTFFAGPVLYTSDWIDWTIDRVGPSKILEYGLGVNTGLGLSYYLGNVAELYASASILGPVLNVDTSAVLPSVELGSRFFITDRFNLGVGIICTLLGGGLGVTAGTVLGNQ